ncbi:hypothetical protein J500_0522 [Acinetobacter sp. 479375]|nr:hypothetical protein J500_0522 [Acinetobacter sp. 479375]
MQKGIFKRNSKDQNISIKYLILNILLNKNKFMKIINNLVKAQQKFYD